MKHNTSKISIEATVKPVCPVYKNTYFKQQYKGLLNQSTKIGTRLVSISSVLIIRFSHHQDAQQP